MYRGNILRQAIRESGQTLAGLAEQAPITPGCLYKLLDGTRSTPSGATVMALAIALGVPTEMFDAPTGDAQAEEAVSCT